LKEDATILFDWQEAWPLSGFGLSVVVVYLSC
jgi:uncharacterized membrane protein